VMFWKFDRLARGYEDVIAIKILLRQTYGIKLYCVEGYSEDEDHSEYTAMMEHALAVFSAFYSRNLVTETKRGKKQRAMNGEFNGSQAPVGYEFVTQRHETKERPFGLYPHPEQAPIVREAFERYSTGKYSDAEIAAWMQTHQPIQELRLGKKPVDKEMVRDFLQNRVYTGRVRYTDTVYKEENLVLKRASRRHRSEWFEGKHAPIISDELFETCLAVRKGFGRTFTGFKHVTYLFHDRAYCSRCLMNKPHEIVDDKYGKLRVTWLSTHHYSVYRCLCHERGYAKCGQKAVPSDVIDQQVIAILKNLQLSEQEAVVAHLAINRMLEQQEGMSDLAQLRELVKGLNVSWESGYVPQSEYDEKIRDLKTRLDDSRQSEQKRALGAEDLLMNFEHHWAACLLQPEPELACRLLVSMVVKQVVIYDQRVVGVVLNGDITVSGA
jgi:hypothetical protein